MNRPIFWVLALFCLPLAACSDSAITKAEKAFRDVSRDPDSVEFKELQVKRSPGEVVVCGYVNTKNAFGDYPGFTPFIATTMGENTAAVLTFPDEGSNFGVAWIRSCG